MYFFRPVMPNLYIILPIIAVVSEKRLYKKINYPTTGGTVKPCRPPVILSLFYKNPPRFPRTAAVFQKTSAHAPAASSGEYTVSERHL